MKSYFRTLACSFLLAAATALLPLGIYAQNISVRPARGGGLDTNAPMIHVDILYDYAANQMHANVDTNYGIPKLVSLPPGYTFEATSNYFVLYGKAYNFQFAWNPGGLFTNPPGAALWIECLSASPGLECYDGPGNRNLLEPRTYAPIFGTAASSPRWKWYGSMAHNSYAVLNPSNTVMSAQYRVYFGDATTGAPEPYAAYDDAVVTLTWTVEPVTVVSPSRGGGLVTEPMIHVDVHYDYAANQMVAILDTSLGIPTLRALPPGYTFDARSNYYVFNGKAYNYQLAWNPGAVFTNPPGAALWIECLSSSPGLECYDGPGNKNLAVPRTYAPIFGTGGSSRLWQWYGKMAHNTYAVLNPTVPFASAQYRLYFGDAVTGTRDAYAHYGDAMVTLNWLVEVTSRPLLVCGALDDTNGAALMLLNAGQYITNSLSVINLNYTNAGPCAFHYACCPTFVSAPATPSNGGPVTNHAALGSRLDMEWVSLSGPSGGILKFWDAGMLQPTFSLPVGECVGAYRVALSQNEGEPAEDPFGAIAGRQIAANKPGLYCLGFRLVDSSTNGPAGGPIHAESPLYYIYFQAGLTMNALARVGATATVSYGGELGRSYFLERSADLTAGAWQTVAGPLAGTNSLQALTDAAAPAGNTFYRLRATRP